MGQSKVAPSIDFSFANHGSLYLVTATNTDALKHLEDNVSDEAQWMGESLAVEPRYAGSLADALVDAGFTVAVDG